ncbi:inactive Rho GTPase-activating protein 11B-like isoform X2 [Osmerus eperlanus]|uniref:inactive Rho GTPase-activating protein 11B-like isoform X2 n=1 Tax=Osmerus eperlanus TaxID=29151 RepID=UPI002E0D91DD
MKIKEHNVIPVSVSHYLHVVHGIKLKTIRREKEKKVTWGLKVFGVSLECLPQCSIAEDIIVPRFLVDACMHLSEHVCTVGLFRKSGSVLRQRALRARLNRGEACLSTAFPCDVACLLKQFCRELPKPLFPSDLQAALLKAQQLPSVSERTSAIQLLSCLLPKRNLSFLRYILNFLSRVSQRCSENQMTCSNLALIFAPCLMSLCNTAEELDRSIHLKTEVVLSLIENAYTFGVIPEFILKSVPVLLYLEEKTHSERSTVLEGTENQTHSPQHGLVQDLDERPSSASGLDERLSSASGLDERLSSASGLDERLSSASGLDERPSSASGLDERPSSASGLDERPSSASVLDERSTPRRRPSLRRSLGMETFPSVLAFRCNTLHTAHKPWSHTASLSKSPLNSHREEQRTRFKESENTAISPLN